MRAAGSFESVSLLVPAARVVGEGLRDDGVEVDDVAAVDVPAGVSANAVDDGGHAARLLLGARNRP